jgi:curved DNA-binding protein CbpA
MPSTMNQTNVELEEDDNADNPDEELELVRRAYDVLKDDASRYVELGSLYFFLFFFGSFYVNPNASATFWFFVRLLYHRFGLLDTAMAAMVLTGEGNSLLSASHSLSQEQRRLMTFMGYPPQYHRLNVQERHSQVSALN